jgi:hypothetical protein
MYVPAVLAATMYNCGVLKNAEILSATMFKAAVFT